VTRFRLTDKLDPTDTGGDAAAIQADPMSYRVYHDYDDDRDVITCVTLSDTRPVAHKEHTCGGYKKTIPWGRATAAARRRSRSCEEWVHLTELLPSVT